MSKKTVKKCENSINRLTGKQNKKDNKYIEININGKPMTNPNKMSSTTFIDYRKIPAVPSCWVPNPFLSMTHNRSFV